MKLRLLGTGMAMAVSITGVVLATPVASYASTTCYTGCHTSTPKTAGGKPTTTGLSSSTPTAASTPADGSTPTAQASALAFTGANVIVPTGIGGGAILVGGALVFAGKRRRVNSATPS
jgi:hypothetical protein